MTSLLSKMSTDDVGMQQERRIIIKFLVAEGVPSAEIHHRLAAVFKDDCLSRSHVFEWCSHFCDGCQHVGSMLNLGACQLLPENCYYYHKLF